MKSNLIGAGDMCQVSSQQRERWMKEILARRHQAGTFREMRISEKDRCFIDFSSNDYLGLGRAAELLQSIRIEEKRVLKETAIRRQKARHFGGKRSRNGEAVDSLSESFPVIGSSGSRLLSGNSWYAEDLERWIAGFHRRESALLFNSGYDANLGLMSCLPQPGDVVVCDEFVHNSVRMGCRLGRQRQTIFFRHNDVEHLDTVLRDLRAAGTIPPPNIFIAVESVYSMDGDLSPLEKIFGIADNHAASVIVDEAHGTGIFGEEGRGLVAALHLESHPALLASMHSFGKALGVHGAVVVGSATLKEFLVNYARPLIYSTSLPLHSLACIKCAYVMQAKASDRRRRVFELADMFQSILADEKRLDGTCPLEAGDVPCTRSPIQSVVLAGNERSLFVAESLRALGFDVRAIRMPTVPKGTERLRVTLHAYNTDAEVASLARHIRRLAAQDMSAGAPRLKYPTIKASSSDITRDSPPSLDMIRARL